MIIGIKVVSENVKTGVIKHTNTCYFTMVAKGEDDKPTAVPPLLLENRTDVRRFVEAIKRKTYKKEYDTLLDQVKRNWDKEAISSLLQGQRCEVATAIQ